MNATQAMTAQDAIERCPAYIRRAIESGLSPDADQRTIRAAFAAAESRVGFLFHRRMTEEHKVMQEVGVGLHGRFADEPAPCPTTPTETAVSLLAAAHLSGYENHTPCHQWVGYGWSRISVAVRVDPHVGVACDAVTVYVGEGDQPAYTRSGWISDPALADIAQDLRDIISERRSEALAYRPAHEIARHSPLPGRAFLVADQAAQGSYTRAEAAAARVRDWLSRHPFFAVREAH